MYTVEVTYIVSGITMKKINISKQSTNVQVYVAVPDPSVTLNDRNQMRDHFKQFPSNSRTS